MLPINDKIKKLIEGNAIALSTIGEDGNPHCIAVAFVKVVSGDQLLITDNYMVTTPENLKKNKNVEVVICPPFMYLPALINKGLAIGAQNCHWEAQGAYTGEVSPAMLADAGAEYIILGHSERRRYLGETDEIINLKLKAALKARLKPIICIGENQVLPGLDKELVGKEVGQEYEITLSAEQAFGKRDIKKMKIVPMSTFIEHKVQPQPGLQIDVDGERGIVARVSGGRIIVNFNHPLAGREVMYSFKIVRKITDASEKVKSYLGNVLRIPREKVEVKVADNQVEITLPVDFPAVLTDLLTKKLLEVTGVKEVLFKKKEVKAEEKPAGK